VLPLYTTCNEVAALHEEMNEAVAVSRGGTTGLPRGFIVVQLLEEFFDEIRAPDGLEQYSAFD